MIFTSVEIPFSRLHTHAVNVLINNKNKVIAVSKLKHAKYK